MYLLEGTDGAFEHSTCTFGPLQGTHILGVWPDVCYISGILECPVLSEDQRSAQEHPGPRPRNAVSTISKRQASNLLQTPHCVELCLGGLSYEPFNSEKVFYG